MSWWHACDLIFKALTVFAVSAWQDPTWEYRALVGITVLQLTLVLWFEPFRFDQHNQSEQTNLVTKVLILAAALPSFETNDWSDSNDGRVVFIFAVGGFVLGLGVVVSIYRFFTETFAVKPPSPVWDASEGYDMPTLIKFDSTEEGEALPIAAAEAPVSEEPEKVSQTALMSLRFKHASVLWTLAAHWTKNRAGHIECKVLKEYQQKIIQRLKEGIDLRDLPLILDLNEQLFENVKRAM